MRTLDIVVKARTAIETICGQKAEKVTQCQQTGEGFTAHVEVTEMKGRLADNDLLASYMLTFDAKGEVIAFERVRQYTRAKAAA
jgi:hypothetical protein